MKAMKVITDPNAFQLLADETRRRMIYLLRVKDLTVSQIASELHLTPQAIYHQIRKLKDAGMIDIAREERVGHFIETYYQASAEVFHIAHGGEKAKKEFEALVKEAIESLALLGMEVKCDPPMLVKIIKVQKEMKDCSDETSGLDWAEKVKDLDFFAQQHVQEYAGLLEMSDAEFVRYQAKYAELRELLKKCAKPAKKGK
jgi:DNA-binding transcriptional ArsR family regulator